MPNLTPGGLLIVNVSLDTESHPPVSVDPPVIEVRSATTIVWQVAVKSRIQDFRFFEGSLHFTNGAGLISKQEQGARCSIYDTTAVKDKDDIVYTLMVEHQGKYYSTGAVHQLGRSGPCIRNL